MKIELGKLTEIDIRKVWAHEQYHFSQWLAEENNIRELGDALNLSLTDIETEKFVGSFRCDILCKDEVSGKNVLIENQLEPTNHDHLGKIITYASGLDASVVVWIVAQAREEHASAIRWLNSHTDDTVSFFLLEIHAFVIGDSVPAPKFVIVEKPNDFAKSVKTLSKTGGEDETKAYQHEFWTKFNEVLEQRGKPFKMRTPPMDYSYRVPLGSSHYRIEIELQKKRKFMDVCLWILDNKDMFESLLKNKTKIETAIDCPVEWFPLDNKKSSAVTVRIPGLDFENQANYPELMNKAIDIVVTMINVCLPILKEENDN